MRVKIVRNDENKIAEFQDLEYGDGFVFDNCPYIKTSDNKAFDLEDIEVAGDFDGNDEVIEVNITITVK